MVNWRINRCMSSLLGRLLPWLLFCTACRCNKNREFRQYKRRRSTQLALEVPR